MNRKRTQLIYEHLHKNTCEGHPTTILQLVEVCKKNGIKTNRNTIYTDINFFEEIGVDIICIRSVQNRYYIGQRQFEIPELKMMIDAINSAQFISKQNTKKLIEKLLKTVSIHESKKLLSHIDHSNNLKKKSEKIFYEIDCINEGIINRKKISFYYFKYNDFGEEEKQNSGERYNVLPYYLRWNDDKYYLLGHSYKDNEMRTYRVDRIREAKINEECCAEGFEEITTEKGSTFNMYFGETVKVELLCKSGSMDYIIDKFGSEYEVVKREKKEFVVQANVMISPPFFGWVFMLSGKISLVGPQKVLEEYNKMIRETREVLK